MTTKEFKEKILKQLIIDLKDVDNYKSFKHGSFIYDLGYYQGNLLINEIERLNNIINKARRKLGEHKYYLTPTEEQNKENEIITEEVYQILHENLYELKELKENK